MITVAKETVDRSFKLCDQTNRRRWINNQEVVNKIKKKYVLL